MQELAILDYLVLVVKPLKLLWRQTWCLHKEFSCSRDPQNKDPDFLFICFCVVFVHRTYFIFTLYHPQDNGTVMFNKITEKIDIHSECSTEILPYLGTFDHSRVSVKVDAKQKHPLMCPQICCPHLWMDPFWKLLLLLLQQNLNNHPWFTLEYAAAIAHYSHYYNIYYMAWCSRALTEFRTSCNHCKRVLENAKCNYAQAVQAKVKSKWLGSCMFWKISN